MVEGDDIDISLIDPDGPVGKDELNGNDGQDIQDGVYAKNCQISPIGQDGTNG